MKNLLWVEYQSFQTTIRLNIIYIKNYDWIFINKFSICNDRILILLEDSYLSLTLHMLTKQKLNSFLTLKNRTFIQETS